MPSIGARANFSSSILNSRAPVRLATLIDAHPEVRRQLDLADRVVLTKGDLVPERLPGARELLDSEAPGCEVREAIENRIDRHWLLAPAPLQRIRDARAAHDWLHHNHQAATFRMHSVQVSAAARIVLIERGLPDPALRQVLATLREALSATPLVEDTAKTASEPSC